MIRSLIAASSVFVLFVTQVKAQPISVHPDNPHYYLFHGRADDPGHFSRTLRGGRQSGL